VLREDVAAQRIAQCGQRRCGWTRLPAPGEPRARGRA
jgi:hypothetical protein